MDVVLLGTGSPLPHPERAGPATLVRAGDANLLFDCGRAVVMRLSGAGLPDPNGLTGLFVTHLHSDHTTALSDLLTTRWIFQSEDHPLRVWGPDGTGEYVDRVLEAMRHDIGYRIAHHATLNHEPSCDVTGVSDGVVFDENGVVVRTALVEHGPVRPALSYRVEHDGKSVVISGDTVPCEGLDRLCAGADVYVQTVLRRENVLAVPNERFHDILTYHSDLEGTARTAERGGVQKLVLTHLMPPPPPGDDESWAEPWLVDIRAIYDGDVVLGRDLLTVTV